MKQIVSCIVKIKQEVHKEHKLTARSMKEMAFLAIRFHSDATITNLT